MNRYGGIEAGGTKFVCVVATGPDQILAEERFPTRNPDETIEQAIHFFQAFEDQGEHLHSIGIGAFGPVDLDPFSPTFGYVTSTPKPGWAQTNLAGRIQEALNLPVAFDTDVNTAALGEGSWGAAKGLDDFIYLTIGTGVGGGAILHGKPVHGLVHPEMGHILLPHDWRRDPFPGNCPFHGDCFEGLASGPAIARRWGKPGYELPPDHPAWELEAEYIAKALHSLACTLSPKLIILGGGVMDQSHLFPMIREKLVESLRDYVQSPKIIEDSEHYVVPPALGNRAGVLGAIALAMQKTK